SQDLCTGGTDETTQTIDIIYADTQVAMTTAKVENGRFTAELFIPASMSEYAHRIGRLHSCAFDPESRLIAASMYAVTFLEKDNETSQDKDTTPPVIDIMEYDQDLNAIRIEAHDDVALSFSRQPLARSIELKIDGMLYQTALRHEAAVSNDGRTMSKDVPLNDLVEGTHTALLTIADVAGNTTTREIAFAYNPSRARLAIGLLETAVRDCATIRMDGAANPNSGMTADIIIIDSQANVVYRGAFTNGEFKWDVRDNDGNRVTPGLYKAYILETGDYPDKRHSNTIDIPVI
ncbi:MAG: hypothetical protein K2M03_07345, partial [Muribaculaceae bacterium]|nr:hypothetical protein [Muribaculaceae bacterium]